MMIEIKPQRVGLVSTDVFTDHEKEMIEKVKNISEEEEQSALRMGVSVERLREFRAYVKKLKTKHPQMKPDRVARKAAEYFKIKLT
jgi:uncharacterized short protein YbdD (DUF466 family)